MYLTSFFSFQWNEIKNKFIHTASTPVEVRLSPQVSTQPGFYISLFHCIYSPSEAVLKMYRLKQQIPVHGSLCCVLLGYFPLSWSCYSEHLCLKTSEVNGNKQVLKFYACE